MISDCYTIFQAIFLNCIAYVIFVWRLPQRSTFTKD